jgi:hypothetical protein
MKSLGAIVLSLSGRPVILAGEVGIFRLPKRDEKPR